MKSIPLESASFKYHFQVGDIFQDRLISAISGKYSLDIVKFNDFLHNRHGYKEKEHGSMMDFIEMKFGIEALNFIKGLLCIN